MTAAVKSSATHPKRALCTVRTATRRPCIGSLPRLALGARSLLTPCPVAAAILPLAPVEPVPLPTEPPYPANVSLLPLTTGHLYLRDHQPDDRTRPCLILLHGIGDDGEPLATWCQPLRGHLRCIIPDLRGHGWSSRQASYSLNDYSHDLLTLLDSLQQPAHLFGHSLGGLIAMQVARTHPGKVSSLILEDPPLFHLVDSITSKPHIAAAFSRLHQQRCAAKDHAQLLATMLDEDPERPLEQVRRRCSKHMACDPAVWEAALSNQLQAPTTTAPITCPTTLLQGNPNRGGVIAEGEEGMLQAICPHLQQHLVPECGHNPRYGAMDVIQAHLAG